MYHRRVKSGQCRPGVGVELEDVCIGPRSARGPEHVEATAGGRDHEIARRGGSAGHAGITQHVPGGVASLEDEATVTTAKPAPSARMVMKRRCRVVLVISRAQPLAVRRRMRPLSPTTQVPALVEATSRNVGPSGTSTARHTPAADSSHARPRPAAVPPTPSTVLLPTTDCRLVSWLTMSPSPMRASYVEVHRVANAGRAR